MSDLRLVFGVFVWWWRGEEEGRLIDSCWNHPGGGAGGAGGKVWYIAVQMSMCARVCVCVCLSVCLSPYSECLSRSAGLLMLVCDVCVMRCAPMCTCHVRGWLTLALLGVCVCVCVCVKMCVVGVCVGWVCVSKVDRRSATRWLSPRKRVSFYSNEKTCCRMIWGLRNSAIKVYELTCVCMCVCVCVCVFVWMRVCAWSSYPRDTHT